MKKIFAIGVTAIVALGLNGCTPGNNTSGATITGAAAGGLIGSSFFQGKDAWMGTLGFSLLGGALGNAIGQRMDQEDRIRMSRAVTEVPIGEESRWTNSHDVDYVVRPVREYHVKNRYCREYRTVVTIGDKVRKAYGKACRMPDGRWKIVK